MPIHLHLARQIRQRVRFHAGAGDTQLLGLDKHRSGAAERIQNTLSLGEIEARQIVTHQMRREGKYEAIPFMDAAILGIELILLAVAPTAAGNGIAHRRFLSGGATLGPGIITFSLLLTPLTLHMY